MNRPGSQNQNRHPWRGGVHFLIAAVAITLALAVLVPSSQGQTAVPATLRIPKVKPHPPGTPQAAAEFSHRSHAGFQCYACHPATFPQARKGFTHLEMRGGLYCGACHDGGTAVAMSRFACESCHVP